MLSISKTCQITNLASIYNSYFGNKKGFFIEVGAFDGESFSNTSCLADSGWKGIYIEPVEKFYKKCAERHKNNNVKVINAAIGLENKIVDIYVGEALSSLDKNQVNAYNQISWSKGICFSSQKCRQITLESVLTESSPNDIDLLVIDVEGKELEVLESFNLDKYRPKMIICEIEDEHDSFQPFPEITSRNKKVRALIGGNCYKEIYRDHINTIFLDEKNNC